MTGPLFLAWLAACAALLLFLIWKDHRR